MANLKEKTTIFSRLRNRYRLVIMNDETYEEVAAFKLDKLSVYVTLCTIFIILVSLTVALIVFTPMRYYIPGYGSQTDRRQLMAMKQRSDSIEKKLKEPCSTSKCREQIISKQWFSVVSVIAK
jgi:hypothetical protein